MCYALAMNTFRVQVDFADGDNFDTVFTSAVEVLADTALDARLLAEQLALTPQPGKPDHLQIIHTTIAPKEAR